MKSIKKFLRKLDVFGVPMNFRYKSKYKYSTSLGGFTLILFCLLSSIIVIYYLIKFINKENFTTIYYTVNIPKTEIVILKNSNATFTVDLDCTTEGRFKADDILKVEMKYVNYTKNTKGEYNKNKTLLPTHYCTHQDFHNIHNDSFDRLKLQNFHCLDDFDYSLSGIYSDQIFTYFEYSVVSKYETEENLDNIEEFLFNNDCKLKIVYTDITIDLNNYKEPIKTCLNEVFIQLNPTLFIKRNIFFMNQYLIDNDDILFDIFIEQNYPFIKTLYSRYEEYALYKGLNRSKTNPFDKYKFASLYIRADTKKTEIKRKYQNIMEFYADVSSLLLSIFRFLLYVFEFINNFYAEYSFAKGIFFFKEFENRYFDIYKRQKQINQLKSLINNYNEQNTQINSFNSDFYNYLPNEKIFRNFEINTYNKIKKKDIDTNNECKRNSISYSNQIIGNLVKDGNNSRNILSSSNKQDEQKQFSNNINSTIDKDLIKKMEKI